ncbi:MAG: histidine kinase [Pseudonocardiaceae bacterium]|nr:histidine kinase [Pseudonocardiaceae bacterium]
MRAAGITRSDVLLTGTMLAVTLLAAFVLPPQWKDDKPVDAIGVALIVLATSPVLVRRRFPVLALVACVPVEVAYHALDYWHEASLPVAVTALAVVLTVGLTRDGPPGVEVISPLSWFLVAFVTGQAVRFHRAYMTEWTERRVMEERLRIARDLHDVLAHHVVVINSHAAVAAHLLDERTDDPSLAPIAGSLHTVADASSGVLSELRTTLDVLRGNDVDGDRQPTPSLARLPSLASVTEAAGVSVSVDVLGDRRPLGSGVEVTLYRINVVRHAGARSARVVLSYAAEAVRLEVVDDGHGALSGDGREGYGIVGMTERAHSLGGRLDVGNGPEGGFRVVATVPA